MDIEKKIDFIIVWIKNYIKDLKFQPVSLVIGVSGGVDSALTSTLCAKTGLKTIAISMPIKQNINQHDLSLRHLNWLQDNFSNVETSIIELDSVFNIFESLLLNFKALFESIEREQEKRGNL